MVLLEVHHHAHTPRKKWTHYFWEFLMLFLAVFCGFLAEYQLEHKIEKDREKIYMQNMLDDLKADTAIYSDYAARNAVVRDLVDTIMVLIKSPDRRKHISKLAYSLSELDTYNNVGMIWSNNYAQAMAKLFDGEALLRIIKEKKEVPLTGEALISEDKIAINELLTSAGYFYGALSLNDQVASIRKDAAERLIVLIDPLFLGVSYVIPRCVLRIFSRVSIGA